MNIFNIYTYIYVYIYILYYCRVFISINGRRINYKCIIATNNFMCVIRVFLDVFLDVSFNLDMGKFFPYRKPSNTPLYIHSESNHPPPIIKQLPSMTNKRISNLSCNEHEFS